MTNAILAFPRRSTRFEPDTIPSHPQAAANDIAIPAHELWRRLPADAFGEAERAALDNLLATARPFGVDHWREALAGDDAAAVAMALKLCGIAILHTWRHDLVLSMLLWHALQGSAAARMTLAFTLDRRCYCLLYTSRCV